MATRILTLDELQHELLELELVAELIGTFWLKPGLELSVRNAYFEHHTHTWMLIQDSHEALRALVAERPDVQLAQAANDFMEAMGEKVTEGD